MPTLDSSDAVMTLLIFLPLSAAVGCCLIARTRIENLLMVTTSLIHLLLSFQLAAIVVAAGPQLVRLGGHRLPLAIALRADGLAVLMVCLTAVVCAATAVYACGWATTESPERGNGMRILLLTTISAMTALFLADDLFNLYVTLEVATLSAVAMVILTPGRGATEAAMRYLLLAIVGSLLYLLGVTLVYADTARLSMHLLSGTLAPSIVLQVSLLLMTAGLGIKAALFPMHTWLPAAHASAPSPGSALLSALVAKGAVYLILRLWTGAFSGIWTPGSAQLFAAIGLAGMLYASLQAMRQGSIKHVIAYSTIAQLGYLPMLTALPRADAWLGAGCHAMSHGLAKAALFLAAGNLIAVHGNDRPASISKAGRRMGLNTLTFGMAGVSLIGLPPSGGFLAKWWLIRAALSEGQWWWAVGLLVGSLLAAAYILRILGWALLTSNPPSPPQPDQEMLPAAMAWPPLALAVAAILVSFLGTPVARLIMVGAPAGWSS